MRCFSDIEVFCSAFAKPTARQARKNGRRDGDVPLIYSSCRSASNVDLVTEGRTGRSISLSPRREHRSQPTSKGASFSSSSSSSNPTSAGEWKNCATPTPLFEHKHEHSLSAVATAL